MGDIFEEGRQSGEMRQDLDPFAARRIVIGTMDHIITLSLLKDMSFPLFSKMEETFDLLESAFSSQGRREG